MTSFIIAGVVGPWQIAIVIVLILLLFGGKKIPEMMKGIGTGLKDFKNAIKEDEPEKKKETEIVSKKDDSKE